MKNTPLVMKEMPNGVPHHVPGKDTQKGRQLASVNELDFTSSTIAPIPAPAFHQLFQDSLRVHDQAGNISASLSVEGQDRESAAGKTQLTPSGGERGLLPLASTKSRLGKGKLISTGVKGKAGEMISMEEFLNANPNVAVSSQNIPMVDNNLRPPQEPTESHVRLQNASGKTHDHLQSGLRHAGEYSVVRGEKGRPSKNAAIAETGGNAEVEHVSDVADATRRIQSVQTMYDQENRGPSDDSPLLSMFGEGSGKRAQTSPRVKTPPLFDASVVAAVNPAPLSLGSENGSDVLSLGRQQHASVKMHDYIRSGRRHTGGNSAFPEEKIWSTGNIAIVETDGKAKMRPLDDAGDVTSNVHSVDTRYDRENTRPAYDSPLLALLREDSGKRTQTAPREKTSLLATAVAVPAADAALISVGSDDEKGIPSAELTHNVSERMHDHARSGRRHTGEYSAVPEEKGGPSKNATIAEMEGNVKAVYADDVGAVTFGVHGTETIHNGENKGRPDGSPLLSLLKENLGEHLRRAAAGEKTSLFSTASAIPAVDAASISGGSDNGEGILSPGRQAQLLAEVIDTARPLAQQGGGRVRISLSPPSLGALEIDVRVKKEGVELFVIANNSDVQQTLCSNVDQLRKALVEQGLNMDRFQVVVGDRSDGQQGRDPRQEGMSSGHREAWSEEGYLAGLDGDMVNDEMGNSTLSGSYPSVEGINLFI